VALDDDDRSLLMALGARDPNADVADLVLDPFELALAGPRLDVVADGLLVPGGTRDLADLVEVLPEELGLEVRKRTGHGAS
jgi:hypothetical protein